MGRSRAQDLLKLLNGDTLVAFIYSASRVGIMRAALGPDGNPRTFDLNQIHGLHIWALNLRQVWKVPVRPVRHSVL
jgi:hypothetical protein